jgi:hypothetical protein
MCKQKLLRNSCLHMVPKGRTLWKLRRLRRQERAHWSLRWAHWRSAERQQMAGPLHDCDRERSYPRHLIKENAQFPRPHQALFGQQAPFTVAGFCH